LHFNINKRDDETIDSVIPTTRPKKKNCPEHYNRVLYNIGGKRLRERFALI